MPSLPAPDRPDRMLRRAAKQAIVGRVRAVFNDRARGERPVARSDDALFARGSVIWRVHGDVTTMMVGGVAALLLQMLHPAVLAGVWDHSNFRGDMHGRLRRTARFIALTTYGSRAEAEAAIGRVNGIHRGIAGSLPDGTRYCARDPMLLAWVHVTEVTAFLDAWLRYGDPFMSKADQDRYFAEVAQIARALGADPIPVDRKSADRLIADMRGQLRADERTREVRQCLLAQHAGKPSLEPLLAITLRAGVDLLPDWARRMHGLARRGPERHALRAGALGIARTLRWAFE